MVGNILQGITGFLQHNNNPLGLLLLGVSAMVEYVFPPFPGDTVTLFGAFLVVQHEWSLALVYGVVMVGSGIGAILDFWIGVWLGKRYGQGRFLKGPKVRAQVEKVLSAFRCYGEEYVGINRFFPAIRGVIFLAAGMAGLRPVKVLFYALISAAAWNGLIIGVGYGVGAKWEKIQGIFRNYGLATMGVVVIVAGVFFVRWVLRRRRAAADQSSDSDAD
ncbi:MAG: DedA family protein [Pseudomonadota bacterium]